VSRELALLIQKRERLLSEVAVQRVILAQNIEPWRAPLALADRGISALHYIRHNPRWLVGGVVLLIALRPAGIGTWLGRGLLAWQLLHRLRGAPLIPEEPR
tara:strand:+ start:3140 stop:3442 length:303 start_codon:yes stop_codon:yes gene_type:complete